MNGFGLGLAPLLGMIWLLLGTASCSFTTATGFNECDTDTSCDAAHPGGDHVCIERYCIKLTPGCKRQAGEFTSANRAIFAASLPLTSTPDSGIVDESEQQGLNALSLAVDEGNLRDGIKGRKFALLFCNNGGDDALAKAQVDWLGSQLKVPAVVTSGSGQTIAIANVAAMRDMMVMSATSTSPELIATFQSQKQLVWRTAPSDSLQARVMSDLIEKDPAFAATDAGAPTVKIGILYVNTVYGQGLSAGLQSRLPARFLTQGIPYELGGDVTAAVNSLDGFVPKLTMVVGFPPDLRNIVAIAKTKASLSRAANHRWLFSDSAKDPALLIGTAEELAGSLGTAPAQGAGPTFLPFRDRFIARFKKDPTNFSFTSHSYDAMYLLMVTAAWASAGDGGITGPRMVDGMRNVSKGPALKLEPPSFTQAISAMAARTSIDAEGASGNLTFDLDGGAPSSPYELWRIEADGGLTTTMQVEPSGL